MNEQQFSRLQGHAESLLDLFIALREKHAMLHPLAFDEELAKRIGRGPQARGHLVLQNVLLYSCVLDVARLTLDQDKRNPSVANLVTALGGEGLRDFLREEFACWPLSPADHDDEEVKELLAEMRLTEEEERRGKFDELWADLHTRWPRLRDGDELQGFKTWRDKLIAHADLHHHDGKYRLFDLSTLGLKWGTLGILMAELQQIVEAITLLVRNAGFGFKQLDEQLAAMSDAFWAIVGTDAASG